jgi:predicted RNA binding protein YcfA (HicA-like mRNA interferase family)
MPRLTPQHWKVLACIFQKYGFEFNRQSSSHLVYTKNNCPRPIIIQKVNEVCVEHIKRNMRTAGMSREEYFQLLKECK